VSFEFPENNTAEHKGKSSSVFYNQKQDALTRSGAMLKCFPEPNKDPYNSDYD
jgi:hypothetical protein